jgi:hypothetical protein
MTPEETLITRLAADFPEMTFAEHSDFSWRPENQTIRFNPKTANWAQLLLHELGHACLGHTDYTSDMELIRIEAAAWSHAKEVLSGVYGVDFDDDFIEDCKDSYRDWLFKRSRCPQCEYGGCQIAPDHYKCPSCLSTWRVNADKSKRTVRRLCHR